MPAGGRSVTGRPAGLFSGSSRRPACVVSRGRHRPSRLREHAARCGALAARAGHVGLFYSNAGLGTRLFSGSRGAPPSVIQLPFRRHHGRNSQVEAGRWSGENGFSTRHARSHLTGSPRTSANTRRPAGLVEAMQKMISARESPKTLSTRRVLSVLKRPAARAVK